MASQTPEASEEIKNDYQLLTEAIEALTPEQRFAFAQQFAGMAPKTPETENTVIIDGIKAGIDNVIEESPVSIDGIEAGIDNALEGIDNQMIMLVIGAVFVFLMIVFFGYKLYKSIKDKEKKKEEKKKAKQQKKKK